MPFNGSGVFQRVRNWVADATAGIKIRADYHDAEDDGFAMEDHKFKKAQASITGEEIRVQSASKDELQEVMTFLRGQDFGLELKFGNYRG